MKALKNRLFTGALAGALAFSLTVPAFAADQTTVITGKYQEIDIAVLVPQTGNAQINPYALPVELDSTNSISGEQIVTKPLAVANQSSVDLSVSVAVTAEAKGDLQLTTTAPAASTKTKSAFVYLQMKHSTMDNADLDSADGNVSGFKAASINPEAASWTQAYSATKDLVLNGAKEVSKENMIVLKAADSSGNIQTNGVGLFRLAGQVVASPTEPWAATDGFTANVAFTFRPDTTTAAIDKATLALDSSTTTGTLTVSLTGANITNVVWTSNGAEATVAAGASNTTATVTKGTATGTATITATITADNGLTYTATCDVTVS